MSLFGFVILHYNTIEDTIECIASIEKNVKDAAYHIVVVDNNSPNKSGKELSDLYDGRNNVTVILNNENLGFAKGNNVGFKYAKDVLKADFIILLNSDTVLLENNFESQVELEYEKSKFAVLGPMIKTPDPPYVARMGRKTVPTKSECVMFILTISLYLFLNIFDFDLCFRRMIAKKGTNNNDINCDRIKTENVQLHGCFLVFSPEYIKEFDGLNPNTFLYREEELLSLRLKQNGLKSVYYPAIQILHKGKSATRSLFHNNRAKRRFEYRERIKSTYVLLKELSKA